ncbi:MAG: hypothetical protein QOG10_2707, partial [Kribbellaceae bacterium]|nr:hypothetical protein [Kribbellaceae bacterium]
MSECPVEQPTDEVLRPLPHPAGRSPLIPTSTDYPAPRPGDRDALAGSQDAVAGSQDALIQDAVGGGQDARPGGGREALAGSEDACLGGGAVAVGVGEDARVASLDARRAVRLARSGWGLYRLPVWAAAAGWRPADDTWVTFLTRRRRLAASYGR